MLPYLNSQLAGITETYKSANAKTGQFGFRKVQHLIVNVAEGQKDTGKMILALTQKVQAAQQKL